MNRLPRIGSKVMGGNVPIVGRKKVDMSAIPRFTGRQLQEFLFDIAFGIAEYQAMMNLKLEVIAEELNIDSFDIDREDYEKEVGRILPQVMASFNFTDNEEAETNEGV